MAAIVNLRTARKRKRRAEAQASASENRTLHGLPAGRKAAMLHRQLTEAARLDGHKREARAEDEPGGDPA